MFCISKPLGIRNGNDVTGYWSYCFLYCSLFSFYIWQNECSNKGNVSPLIHQHMSLKPFLFLRWILHIFRHHLSCDKSVSTFFNYIMIRGLTNWLRLTSCLNFLNIYIFLDSITSTRRFSFRVEISRFYHFLDRYFRFSRQNFKIFKFLLLKEYLLFYFVFIFYV